MIGQTISHYRVTARLGAGGMGEVYRATDTKLRRDVALKVLPEAFAQDAQRMQRFQREAQVLASLNHSNIATIHGLEESGATRALVMELVEGPTLAERIAQGPITVEEALPIARQIAEALEYAHERGIIHRDLKPSNIKLTSDGKVKILDFGLAKALTGDASLTNSSNSPTLRLGATQAGLILGTAAYMSPEQAKGKSVDRRADIWAFGCVLYEMLTRRQAFDGETVTDILAAVVRAEPDWSALPSNAPPGIRHLLRRCFEKDSKQRLRDIGEARIEMEASGSEPSIAGAQVATTTHGFSQVQWWLVVAGLVAAAVFGGALARWIPPSAPAAAQGPSPLLRTMIALPESAPLALGSQVASIGFDSPSISLSPDGTYLAYVAKTDVATNLHLREMASGEIRPVPGTGGVIHSFFSPDGQWIGFLTNDRVKKVPVRGGAPITLCEARRPVLGWWPKEDSIYFTEFETWRLSRVSINGGKPESIFETSKIGFASFTDVLPDGKSALTVKFRGIGGDHMDTYLVDSQTLETKLLVRSGYGARYVPPGYLVFARAGNLMAVRFDPDRREVVGEPVPVSAGAAMESLFMQVHVASSHNGLMAYVSGRDLSIGKLAWVDRKGAVEFLEAPLRVYGAVALAPDGKQVAVHVSDVQNYVWIYDIKRREGRRLPTGESVGWPRWSPDGRRMVVHLSHEQRKFLVVDPERGAEVSPRVTLPGLAGRANSWSPTTDKLAISVFDKNWQIGFLEPGTTEISPSFEGYFPSFSPDGRWVAYASNHKTGANEVFIRSYPDGKVDRQVSVDGGSEPLWNASGELFYRRGNRWFSTRVTTEPELLWDPPRLAFDTDFIDTPGMSYDISPDGQRLLVVKRAEAQPSQPMVNLVVNWTEALKRNVPPEDKR